jgi:hypothetical protein
LKKEAFSWTQEGTKDFENLKEDMCTTPTLTMFNFKNTFFAEFDASGHGIGVVLM